MPKRVSIIVTAEDKTKKVLSGIQRGFQKVGQNLQNVGKKMTMGLTLPIVGVGLAMAKVAADFETQMNILSVAAKDTGTSLDTWREAAIKVGADTELVGIDAAQAAEAMTEMVKAGLDVTDIFGDMNAFMKEGASLSGALRAAIDLQAASELDLAAASDLVTVAMATFGLEAEDAVGIADNFVRAADASVATVGELAAAMVNIGPTAASFGFSLEDVNTALALLSQRGIKGSEAGTALKSMMTNLMRGTAPVQAMLEQLGITLFDSEGNMFDLQTIVGKLQRAMIGLTDEQRTAAIQTLAGTFGMKAMATLLAEGTQGWLDMEAAISGAAGVQESAAARTQGLNAAIETLKGVIETFMIKAGTPLIQNVLTPLVRRLAAFAEKLVDLDPKIITWGLAIAGVLAAAGPVIAILGTLLTVVGALVSPIGLVIVGIGLLVGAFVKAQGGIGPALETIKGAVSGFIERAKALFEKLPEIWGNVKAKLEEFVKGIQTAITPVIDDIVKLWAENWPKIQGIIKGVLEDVIPFATEKLGELRDFITAVVTKITTWWEANFPLIQKTVETVLEFIKGVWEVAWPHIQTVLETAWDNMKLKVETIINTILGIIKAVMQLIVGDWEAANETLKTTAETLWTSIKTIIENTLNLILGFIGTNLTTVIANFKNAWEQVKFDAQALYLEIKGVIETKLAETRVAIENWLAAAEVWFSTTWNNIKAAVIVKWAEVKTEIETAIKDVKTAIEAFKDQFIEAGKSLIDGIKEGVKAKARALWEAAKGVVTAALQAAKNALGMGSPAKKTIPLGESMIEGVEVGILKASPALTGALTGAFENAVRKAGELPKALPAVWEDALTKAGEVPRALPALWEDAVGKLERLGIGPGGEALRPDLGRLERLGIGPGGEALYPGEAGLVSPATRPRLFGLPGERGGVGGGGGPVGEEGGQDINLNIASITIKIPGFGSFQTGEVSVTQAAMEAEAINLYLQATAKSV